MKCVQCYELFGGIAHRYHAIQESKLGQEDATIEVKGYDSVARIEMVAGVRQHRILPPRGMRSARPVIFASSGGEHKIIIMA